MDHARVQRLRWTGHVIRNPGNRIPKRILEGQIISRKRRGRPTTRWRDNVGKDAEELQEIGTVGVDG